MDTQKDTSAHTHTYNESRYSWPRGPVPEYHRGDSSLSLLTVVFVLRSRPRVASRQSHRVLFLLVNTGQMAHVDLHGVMGN